MKNTNSFKLFTKKCIFGGVFFAATLGCSAEETFDSPDTSAEVAICAAVFKLSAATAVESTSKKEFIKIQKKFEKRLFNTMRAESENIENMALQVLTSQLQAERQRDPENGAVKLLQEKQELCSEAYPEYK